MRVGRKTKRYLAACVASRICVHTVSSRPTGFLTCLKSWTSLILNHATKPVWVQESWSMFPESSNITNKRLGTCLIVWTLDHLNIEENNLWREGLFSSLWPFFREERWELQMFGTQMTASEEIHCLHIQKLKS